MIEVKVINKSNNPLPAYATSGSAGCDLMADLSDIINSKSVVGNNVFISKDNTVVIRPGGRALIPTNLFTAIPEGYEVQVRSRSGLAINKGVFVLNSPGCIDFDYRGNWGVILANFGTENFEIKQGDRIAQAILVKYEQIKWNQVKSLDETERKGGFGHTGIDVIDSTVVEEPVVANPESPKLTADEILGNKSKKSSKK